MKCIVLGGFLGSGKTSVLLQLARYLIQQSDSSCETPVVILENEISDKGIDNQMLAGANFTVKNMFSGCICCSGAGMLPGNVAKIEQEYAPEWLLIEATGMAYPSSIVEILQKEAKKDSTVLALVDLKRWKRVVMAMPQFVISQLESADVILLNKKDLVDEQTMEEIRLEVTTYNDSAWITPLSAIEQQPDSFWEKVCSRLMRQEG